MIRLNTVFVGSVVIATAVASLVIHRRNAARASENEVLLQQQENQLAEMVGQNQRLSNLVAQAASDPTRGDDLAGELVRLRTEAESLRQKNNQLSQQVAQTRRSAGVQFFLSGDSNLLDHNKEIASTLAGGPRATGKLNDARALTAALGKYADQHQGGFPSSLDEVSDYLPKPLESNSPPWVNAPLTGTNDFELVFQGTQSDLTNIPPRRVALIRERQPWPTDDGKLGRVYGFVDGAASTVLSDDNFQSWDTQYLIPPESVRR